MLKEKNDSEKLQYLLDNFGSSMYAVANSILNDSYMAEDVVQVVLLRLFREEIIERLEGMGEKERKSYVLMTAKNVALNFYAKRKRENEVTFPEYNEEAVNNISVEDCADIVLRKMSEAELFKIVSNMPQKYSYVLIARYKYDLPDEKIAAVCGISKAAVRKRLERGRKMLLEKLKQGDYLSDWHCDYGKEGH